MENFSTVSKRNAADYVSHNTPVLQQPQLLKLYLVECKQLLSTLEKPKDFEFNLTHIFSNSFSGREKKIALPLMLPFQGNLQIGYNNERSKVKRERRCDVPYLSLRYPFLFYFHSFCSSERQSPEIQCSISMILTKLPCSTGHTVHILPSVLSVHVFQLTALDRWFLYPSLNFCSLQLLSGSLRMLL